MKFVWSEKDIICGRIVCKAETKDSLWKPDGWTAKWTFKIGFDPSKSSDKSVCLICMADGMISSPQSRAELAGYLNSNELIPMPYQWLQKTIEFLRDAYEGFKS